MPSLIAVVLPWGPHLSLTGPPQFQLVPATLNSWLCSYHYLTLSFQTKGGSGFLLLGIPRWHRYPVVWLFLALPWFMYQILCVKFFFCFTYPRWFLFLLILSFHLFFFTLYVISLEKINVPNECDYDLNTDDSQTHIFYTHVTSGSWCPICKCHCEVVTVSIA